MIENRRILATKNEILRNIFDTLITFFEKSCQTFRIFRYLFGEHFGVSVIWSGNLLFLWEAFNGCISSNFRGFVSVEAPLDFGRVCLHNFWHNPFGHRFSEKGYNFHVCSAEFRSSKFTVGPKGLKMGHLGYFGILCIFLHQTWHMNLRCVPDCFDIKTDTKS